MDRYLSEIFDEAPHSWGLRGDPYFWNDLKQHFADTKLPYSANAFVEEINSFFEQTTGDKLTKECQLYVEKYSHRGMSSGLVSGSFWIEQAIPLLLKRLEKANIT